MNYYEVNTFSDKYDLEQHYEDSASIYAIWADWKSVLGYLWKGWDYKDHPAQYHFAWDLESHSLNEAIKLSTQSGVDMLNLSSRKKFKVLDAGCGVGGSSLYMAKKYPKWQVEGINISYNQIKIARRRAKMQSVKNLTYHVGSYLETPFKDDTFDGITGFETFCHVDSQSKEKLFKELNRIVKPGGRVVIFDGFLKQKPVSQKDKNDLKIFLEGWTLPMLYTMKMYERLAKRQKWKIVMSEDKTDRVMESCDEIYRRANFFKPIVKISQNISWIDKIPGINTLVKRTQFNTEIAYDNARACMTIAPLVRGGVLHYGVMILEKK